MTQTIQSPEEAVALVRAHQRKDIDQTEAAINAMSNDILTVDDVEHRQVFSMAEQRANIEQLKGRLRSLRTALARTGDEEFGWCDECGDAIGVQRLLSVPTTRLCIACARRREDQFART